MAKINVMLKNWDDIVKCTFAIPRFIFWTVLLLLIVPWNGKQTDQTDTAEKTEMLGAIGGQEKWSQLAKYLESTNALLKEMSAVDFFEHKDCSAYHECVFVIIACAYF